MFPEIHPKFGHQIWRLPQSTRFVAQGRTERCRSPGTFPGDSLGHLEASKNTNGDVKKMDISPSKTMVDSSG